MERDLDILILEEPEEERSGLEDTFPLSSMITRSFTFVWMRIMPHWTNKAPLASGRVLTVPFRFMDTIFTPSPFFSFLGSRVLATGCFLAPPTERRSFFSVILSLTFWRFFSSSLMSAPAVTLLKSLIVSSAKSLASWSIFRAFSLASRRIRSFAWSIFSFFWRSCSCKVRICSLYSEISRCSLSMVRRFCSRLAITSSKLLSSCPICSRAALMISSDRPSLDEMAKALLLPGMPMSRR